MSNSRWRCRTGALMRAGAVVLAFCAAHALSAAEPPADRLWAGAAQVTYKTGERVQFQVRSPKADKISYTLCEDSRVAPLAQGSLDLSAGNPATIDAKLDHPGFLLLQVKQGTAVALAAAAVDPEAIQSVAEEPADFEAFWTAQLAALKAIPLNARVTPHAAGLTKVVLDQVEGHQVYAWVSIPQGPGPMPAILEFPAFGQGAIVPPSPMPGVITAAISIHNSDLEAPASSAYAPANVEDHRKNYFKYAILGGVRAIDYLSTLPQLDRKRLVLTGKSQGGGLAIIVAGLDPRVTHVSAVVPAFGQHAGTRHARSSGFPWWVWQKEKDGQKAQADVILREAEYYDLAHFARRYKGDAQILAGGLDTICPPSSIMASCNAMPGHKEFVYSPVQDHDWNSSGDNWWPRRQRYLEKVRDGR